jgi:hypothetical protein
VSADTPVRGEYVRRLDARLAALAGRDRVAFRVSQLRLAIVAVGILMLFVWGRAAVPWLSGPILVFVAVAFWHGRLLNSRDRAASAVRFYEESLARLDGRWAGRGRGGDRFCPPDHPYAADLDLFGRASLFELLSTTRTGDGEATLARWLLAPAPAAVVAERQAAVRELTPHLDLRESVAVLGDLVRGELHDSRLRAWAAAPVRLRGLGAPLALGVLAAVTLGALVWAFATGTLAFLALSLVLLEFLAVQWFKDRVEHVDHAVDEAAQELDVLAGLLRLLERAEFQSPLLRRLQGRIGEGARPPSRDIDGLSRRVALLSSSRNLVFAVPAGLTLWTTQWAFAIERWRARVGADVPRWLDAVGEFEALLAFSTLAWEHPASVFPELTDGPAALTATGLAHPVLPATAVSNDLTLGGHAPRLLIVSGSNMSGTSTWLRTIGVSVVLAQAGAPVRASSFRLSPMEIGAAINIQDSLADGRSKFYAEIRRIALVVRLAKAHDGRVLFLFDEILGGTNSHDRRIGAEALLADLIARGAIGLATTHDLALGDIATRLAPAAANVHFEDRFEDGALSFDYCLRPGVVQTSNALALMRSVGLEV